MDWITSPDALVGLLTLIVLEIVLGIDNVVFISILAGKLPVEQQDRARRMGLLLALGTRILLLLTVSWIIGLTAPLFTVLGQEISGRDIILIMGGLFLLGKATHEIHERLEGHSSENGAKMEHPSFASVIIQILLLDVVFSLDSVITAVGMVDEIMIMIIAVVVAVMIMLASAGKISDFVNNHPTVKMLALSFLLLIGFLILAEGFDQHIPKGYVYFAMAFSVFVEVLNLRAAKVKAKPRDPVLLHSRFPEAEAHKKS